MDTFVHENSFPENSSGDFLMVITNSANTVDQSMQVQCQVRLG